MVTTLILIVIFAAYIGLGIPDSLMGSAWPAIYPEFGVSVSNVSFVSLIISMGTIVSSFASERVVKRFKTAPVAVFSTGLTVIALLGYSFSKNMLWLCLCAIPQGIGAGSIDVALNNYVANHYNAKQMNFLHCFYGVGVSLSPYLMSLFLKDGMQWRSGYRTMFFIQLAIFTMLFLSVPLWKKVSAEEYSEEASKKAVVPFRTLAKNAAIRMQWLVFVGSCSIESICLVWGSTFLVNARGLSPEYGAKIITFYFAGLTLGRITAGFIVSKVKPLNIIYIGQAVTLAAIIILLLSKNSVAATIGLFLVGFGNGPVFPNMTQLTPEYFGKDLSQAVIGTQMGFSYVGILVTPLLFGFIIRFISINFFSWYLLIFYAIMMFATIGLQKNIKAVV